MGWLSGFSGLQLTGGLKGQLQRLAARDLTWWAMVALVLLGILLRARGMWFGQTISMWEDEAAWAMWLIDLPLRDHVIRSIGFMTISKGLVTAFSASEQVLRFVPWCAGVGAVALAPLVAKRLCRSVAGQLLFVAVLALHPSAIDLSKEFKPYSVALFVHMALMLFALRYAAEGRERDLLAALTTAFFGVLLSQDVVFAYPMVFGALALTAYRAKNRDHLITVFVGAALALTLLLALLNNVAPKLGESAEGAQYWGNKYNVFYVEGGSSTRLGWTLARSYDLVSVLGNRRDLWHGLSPETLGWLKQVEMPLWSVLYLTGIATLAFQRRFLHLAVVLTPLVVMLGFNQFGLWPFGPFRTNLFTIAYLAGTASVAFDWRPGNGATFWEVVPAFVLVLLPMLTVGRSNHARKASFTAHAAFPQAAKALIALQGKRRHAVLVMNSHSCAPWRYYTRYHPNKKQLAGRFKPECGKTYAGMLKDLQDGLPTPSSTAYMLLSGDEEIDGVMRRLPKDIRIVAQTPIGKRDALVLRLKRDGG